MLRPPSWYCRDTYWILNYGNDWVGSCNDPKYVYEKIAVTIDDILMSMKLVYDGSPDQEFYSEKFYANYLNPDDLRLGNLPWKVTGNYLSMRCYHLDMGAIKDMSTSHLKFLALFSLDPYYIYVNSPNAWKKIDPANYLPINDLVPDVGGKTVLTTLNIAIDVMHMQDYTGEPCNPDPNYEFDKCISEEVDR